MKTRRHIAYGEVDERGVPHAYDKKSTLDFCAQHPGKRIEISYKVVDDHDTSRQRGYYRGVVVPNVRLGFLNLGVRMSEAKVHEELRRMSSVGVHFIDIGPNTIQDVKSTADFEKEDWQEYIDEVIQFAAEHLNVVVPEPVYDRRTIN